MWELQKSALRVGQLSMCWGEEKKLWQDSKTQIEKKKPKNSNCDKTQKILLRQNSKTLILTKLKKLKLRPNTKILSVTKFKNSNCDKTKKEKCDKTQLKLWQNSKTQIATKL